MPQDLIVGLDIGTTKICAVVGEVRDQQLDIVGLGSAPTAGGLRKGVVVNIENTVRAIRRAVEEAETMAGCEIRSVYAGVGGGQTKVINSQGIIAIKDREVTPADMDRVIDTARTVAIPSDREVIHTLVQEFLIDGQDGIKDPVGIHGVRLECKVHIVTGAVTSLNNILKCANRAGLEVNGIALQSLAAGEAVLTDEEKELGVALIDFGGGVTNLAIFAENALRHNFVLPVGGNNLTNDIAVGLPTSLNHAEELKKHYGACLNALTDPDELIEVAGLTGRETQTMPRSRLAEIIHMRVAEILNLLGKEIQRARFSHPLHSGAVLVGGTSLVDGLVELAGETFNMHTRIGYPMGVSGLIDVIHDPSYATGVGLALYGFRGQQKAQRTPDRWSGGGRGYGRSSGGGFWPSSKNGFAKWYDGAKRAIMVLRGYLMKIQLVPNELSAKIKVLGVGGAGGNAINDMISSQMVGVDFIAANTDAQALERSLAPVKIQLGPNVTRGLGAGGDPEVGRNAALEEAEHLKQVLQGADMVFIAAGMGGGTGTGGAPVVAELSRELGALTVAVVSKPFEFEGKMKRRLADNGIEELRKVVDTIITIPNDRLFSLSSKNSRIKDVFGMANEVLGFAVRGISDLIMVPGFINVDFADVRTVMKERGMALMGTGIASGGNRAADAAHKAISSPLLEDISIRGARGILINITSAPDISMEELKEICGIVQEEAHEEAIIKWGLVWDEGLAEEIRVTVIATGIGKRGEAERAAWSQAAAAGTPPEDLEIPTILRNEPPPARGAEAAKNGAKKPLGVVAAKKFIVHPDLQYEENELDTPPFLRKAD